MNIKGIGTDLTKRDRFNKDNIKFNNKFLNKDELEILENLNEEDTINFLSGRWTAKEAIVKAFNKEILFSDISILKLESGKPVVYLNGNLQENIHVSITHEKSLTIAFCVIEKV